MTAFACLVYPRFVDDSCTVREDALVTLDRALLCLKDTGWTGFISPLHSPDEDSDHPEFAPHYHVLCQSDAKNSVKSIRTVLDACGLDYWNRFVQVIKGGSDGYKRYLLYLTHKTARSRDKEQFGGVEPTAFNQPQGMYRTYILGADYQSEVFNILDEIKPMNTKALYDLVDEFLPEHRDTFWRDLPKWQYLLGDVFQIRESGHPEYRPYFCPEFGTLPE